MDYNQPANLVGNFTSDSDRGFKDSIIATVESMKSNSNVKVNSFNGFISMLESDVMFESYQNLLFADTMATDSSVTESFGSVDSSIDDGYFSMHSAKLEQMVHNAREQIITVTESSNISNLAPVTALTFPILKKHYIKQAYKDVIQTVVSDKLNVVLQTEREFVRDKAGNKHFVPEIFYPENEDKFRALNANALGKALPNKFYPEGDGTKIPLADFNALEAAGGSLAAMDVLGYDFGVIAVQMEVPSGDGTTKEIVEINGLDIKPRIQTKNFSAKISTKSKETGKENEIISDTLFGEVDTYKGTVNIASVQGRIVKVKFGGHLSSQNNDVGLTVDRIRETFDILIPEQERINAGITVEAIKDEKVMSNIDVMADRVSRMADYCQHSSDTNTKLFLEDEFKIAQSTDAIAAERPLGFSCKMTESVPFTLKTPHQFTSPESEWRSKQVQYHLERLVLRMVQKLRTDAVMLTIVGNPSSLIYLDNVKWVVDTNTKIGGIKLDYQYGITTIAGCRVRVVSTQKEGEDKGLRIILNTLSDDLITWRKYEYSFVVENGYRNPQSPLTPNVMVAQRYLNYKYLPVQAEFYFKEFREDNYRGLAPLYS